jgi:hypothetical protein
MDSILTSIKKMLGIEETVTQFDTDIIININSVFMILTQLGVGPEEGFIITDDSADWEDFLGDVVTQEAVKTYIYLKVRLIFDPPSSGFVLDSTERLLKEFEWRLNSQAESEVVEEEEEDEC